MTRKIFALLLVMAMLFSITACNNPVEPTDSTANPTNPTTKPTEPTPSDDYYLGLTNTHLDSIGKVTADIFDNQMNVNWNFSWEGDQTVEYNATKVDFDSIAADNDVIWRLGLAGEEGTVTTGNAGWGVQLWAKGEGNIAYMYNKIDVPEYATQFRVWASSNTDNHWSGSGAIRAVALYKGADGNYVKHIFVPKAETFTEGSTAFFNEENGTVEFSNAMWNMPGTLDGCMIIYDMADLAGKEDVVIVVESVGLGTILGDEYTEAAEGVPAGEVMPECVIIKRVMFIVEKPVEPGPGDGTTTTPGIPVDQEVYHGMTGNDLDALASIEAGEFGDFMNVHWNFAWDGNPVAGKVDFAGTAGADSKIWKTGVEGNAAHGDAGWGVQLAPTGVGSNAYLYAKLDVPAEGISQFRIWAALLKNADWSGNAAIRVVAAYKDADGNYVREILVPINEAAQFYNEEDGTVRISGNDWGVDGIPDGMMIYGLGNLAGKEDVVIFVEAIGIEDGTTDHVIVKRIMFL